ncbi:hypothetical protein V6N13_118413 [Hibiscus sabdariffa]
MARFDTLSEVYCTVYMSDFNKQRKEQAYLVLFQLNRNPNRFLLRPFTVPIFTRSSTPKLGVSSTAIVETQTQPTGPVVEGKEESSDANVLACPICYDPLNRTDNSPLCVGSTSGSKLQCNTCKKAYFGNEKHLDLVASSGFKRYDESMPLVTEIFRTPMISFLYERGWRQNFKFGGFPGPEKEFDLAKDYLKPVFGGNIVDASCGSGMFSRLFAKNGLFSQVIALDYSGNMLRQCYEFIEKEENFPKEYLSSALDIAH